MQQVQAMRQDRAVSGLTFPIKLRCISLADLVAEPALEAALTRILGKGFAKARSALPSALSTGGDVALQPPLRCNSARAPDDARKNERQGHSELVVLDIGGSEAKVQLYFGGRTEDGVVTIEEVTTCELSAPTGNRAVHV